MITALARLSGRYPSLILDVIGLSLLTAAAATVTLWAGLAAGGLACHIAGWRISERDRP